MRNWSIFTIGILLFTACSSPQDSTENVDEVVPEVIEEEVVEEIEEQEELVVEETACIPMPTEAFLELKNKGEIHTLFEYTGTEPYKDEVYAYLMLTLDSLESIQVLDRTEEGYPAIWEQRFEGGVLYRSEQISEVGSQGLLSSECTNKNAFVRAIAPVISYVPCENCYDPDQVWNADSTTYQPAEAEAGCYYLIEKDSTSGYYQMSWYCGC